MGLLSTFANRLTNKLPVFFWILEIWLDFTKKILYTFLCRNAFMITSESQKVLQIVLDSGTIRGFELKRRAGLAPDVLINAVRPLVAENLITASGIVNADTIDRVNFSPLSAAYQNAAAFLK